MKKISLIFFAAILVLDFLALDDTTTGNEPNFFFEYATLIVSVPLVFFLFSLIFKNKGV